MGKKFSGRVWNTDGSQHDFENLTEEEVRKIADIRNPDVARAKYTEHDDDN